MRAAKLSRPATPHQRKGYHFHNFAYCFQRNPSYGPDVGSSAKSISGLVIVAQHMESLLLSPPDRPRTEIPPGSMPPTH